MMITSSRNKKIQWVRSLLEHRKERQEIQAFVVEGVRLFEEALQANMKPQLVLYSSHLSERGHKTLHHHLISEVDVEEINDSLMDAVSDTETSQGILAVFPFQMLSLPAQLDFALIVDGLKDPGNLGTILRTALTAGVQAVFLTPGTTDVYSSKVLRAGMGAHFRIPVHQLTWEQIHKVGMTSTPPLLFYRTAVGEGNSCWGLDLRKPLAITLGGEAEGVSHEAKKWTDAVMTIPMPGGGESLNVAVAAGILMFEVVRQRTMPGIE